MACSEGIEKFPVAPWPEARNPSKSGPHFLLTFETHRNASRSAPDFVLNGAGNRSTAVHLVGKTDTLNMQDHPF